MHTHAAFANRERQGSVHTRTAHARIHALVSVSWICRIAADEEASCMHFLTCLHTAVTSHTRPHTRARPCSIRNGSPYFTPREEHSSQSAKGPWQRRASPHTAWLCHCVAHASGACHPGALRACHLGAFALPHRDPPPPPHPPLCHSPIVSTMTHCIITPDEPIGVACRSYPRWNTDR